MKCFTNNCTQEAIAPRSMYGLDKKGNPTKKTGNPILDEQRWLCADHLMENRWQQEMTQTWCFFLLKRYMAVLKNLYHTPDHDKDLLNDIETSFLPCVRGECQGCTQYPKQCHNREITFDERYQDYIDAWHYAQSELIKKRKLSCTKPDCVLCHDAQKCIFSDCKESAFYPVFNGSPLITGYQCEGHRYARPNDRMFPVFKGKE